MRLYIWSIHGGSSEKCTVLANTMYEQCSLSIHTCLPLFLCREKAGRMLGARTKEEPKDREHGACKILDSCRYLAAAVAAHFCGRKCVRQILTVTVFCRTKACLPYKHSREFCELRCGFGLELMAAFSFCALYSMMLRFLVAVFCKPQALMRWEQFFTWFHCCDATEWYKSGVGTLKNACQ